ncbi:MAG: histidine kinase [Candidatus Limivivens sp.]|nr:histidine kinase [Candidatus Limivivens sp.]
MKNHAESLIQRFRDLGIRKKLMFMSIGIILIMALLLGITGYYFVKKQLIEKSVNASINLTEQLGENYGSTLDFITDFVFRQYFEADIGSYLVGSQEEKLWKEKYEQKQVFSSFANNLMNYDNHIQLLVITDQEGNSFYYSDSELDVQEEQVIQAIPCEKALDLWGKECFCPCGEEVILASRAVFDKSMMKRVGVITIGIGTEYLRERYDNSQDEEESLVVLNSENEILLVSDPEAAGTAQIFLEKEGSRLRTQKETKIPGLPYICVTWRSDNNQLWLMYLINTKIISDKSRKILQPLIYIVLFAGLFAGVCAMVISDGIANTICILLEKIRAISKGDFQTQIVPQSRDEIGMLAVEFNDMSGQIQSLIEQVSEEKTKMKSAEIKTLQFEYDALQAKLNPHFLYNTLESINSMAKLHGDEQIARSIYLLGNYLRDTISNKRKFVFFYEELENIRNYIEIQKVSCGDKLEISFSIEESLEETIVPKLILQPLVENAYIHGIAPKVGKGYIVIRAFGSGSDMIIEVEDDGVGMDTDLKKTENSESHTKVGVFAVHKRIQILYGESYGLTISSRPGEGTKVRICMPIRFEGEI